MSVALGAIAAQAHSLTKETDEVVNEILDHLETHAKDLILCRRSTMEIEAHSDSGHLNESKDHSGASKRICLSEDAHAPTFHGAVLTISQIIKYVMTSPTEVELASLFVAAKKCVEIKQVSEEMGWPQTLTPIQVDNTTSVGVVNDNIIPKQTNSMEMPLWLLRCRINQRQFSPY